MKDAEVSKRISMLRFLMIFGVVIVHTPPNWTVMQLDGTWWGYFVSFLQNGVFLAGVPVLTVISGYLLFSSNADLRYLDLLKKKARTLLVPFIIFNLGHIALQMLLRLVTGKWLGADLLGQGLDLWMNSLFSLKGVPENDPLHFLRELIVLVVLSPVLGLLIRRTPVLGMILVSVFFLTNSDSYLMNRGDMAIEFYVGGLAAVYKWDLKGLDKFSYLSLLCYFSACAAVTLFQITNITWLRLTAPILVWSAVAPLVNTGLGRWLAHLSMYSFFLYLTHAPLMRICWIAFQKVFSSVPVPLFTAVAPFAVTLACIGLYQRLNAVMPLQLNWILGSRGQKEKKRINSPSTHAGNQTVESDAEHLTRPTVVQSEQLNSSSLGASS